MTTAEFVIALFYRIDNQMQDMPKHPYIPAKWLL